MNDEIAADAVEAEKQVSPPSLPSESTPAATRPAAKIKRILGKFGPGIVTGASDDDPSGIATYSQVGAQFGFAMLWTMLFSYPLMAGIQEISAWIGRVTGMGIAANIRRHYSVWVLYPVVVLILFANVINLGADIGAMGSALKLVMVAQPFSYAVGFGALSVLAAVFIPYHQYARCLNGRLWCCSYISRQRSRFTSLGIGAYWRQLIPHISLSKAT